MMKTKILYVIVSGTKDFYMEQLFVSVYSARRHNPDAFIEILMDTATKESLRDRGALGGDLERMATKLTVIDLDPSLPAKKRSRMLKTGMRSYVEGDFLYIDCDTIVTTSLDAIDDQDTDVAACRDSHCSFKDNPYRQSDIDVCRKIGIDISGEEDFFNGGVVYSKDTPIAHKFFSLWHSLYLEGYALGVSQDQPSYCKANIQCGHVLGHLDDVWNCELKHGVRYLKDAKVVHYLCSWPEPGKEYFIMNDRDTLRRIKESGTIPEDIAALADDPFLGIPPLTQIFAGDDLALFRTRRFRFLRGSFKKGKKSFLEFLLKVYYHLVGYGKV